VYRINLFNEFGKVTCVILLNLVHTGNIQFLAIFHNLVANEHGLLPKTSKILIDMPK